MDANKAQAGIRAAISVTRQRVTVAKGIILQSLGGGSPSAGLSLVDVVVKAVGVVEPNELVIHPSVDTVGAIRSIAEAFSWKLAAIEALWGLAGSGVLIAEGQSTLKSTVPWTNAVPGGGNSVRAGLEFPELSFPLPGHVRRVPSLAPAADQYLADSDLYLNMLSVGNMHPDVSSALREAVKCFRLELWTAAVAMLGKASEGAWIELGNAVLVAAEKHHASRVKRLRTTLEEPTGPMRKIDAVIKVLEDPIFDPVIKVSNVGPTELRSAAQWSDSVRDSRNTLHFLVSPATPNTYDKVGVLLLAGAPALRSLYELKAAADSTPI